VRCRGGRLEKILQARAIISSPADRFVGVNMRIENFPTIARGELATLADLVSTLAMLYLAYVGFTGVVGILLRPAVAVHAGLSILLVRAWRKERRPPAAKT